MKSIEVEDEKCTHSAVVVGGNKSQKVPFFGSDGSMGYGFTSKV
jgi:hypothetical protein